VAALGRLLSEDPVREGTMKSSLPSAALSALVSLFVSVQGCMPVDAGDPQGGANANDRSAGGEAGEKLETGAMTVSPRGTFVVAQRNTSTLIVDIARQSYRELPFQGDRFVFSPARDVAYVVLPGLQGVVALDLASGAEVWRTMPAFTSSGGAFLARVTSDDRTLLVADYDRVFFIDAQTGDVKAVAKVGALPVDLELLPGEKHAFVVGGTTWDDRGPHTTVSLVDLGKQSSSSVDIPNCAAPVSILPDGSRALVSPTFCTRDAKTAPPGWRNPDPVSVIDIDAAAGTLSFVKNLPGFGPTALLADGRAVAYLDTKRIDASMFEDPGQIPGPGAKQYHLMLIDPRRTTFDVVPIGDKLPRFAPSKDGRTLLVDATRAVVRSEASATITLDGDGLRAEVGGSFGDDSGSLFGAFDVTTKQYVPFTGPAAALDRFVQTPDGRYVFTLRNNGRGGDLFGIDVESRTTVDLGRDLRDIGLLADGTLVLRTRLDPTADGHLREELCFSTDARTCKGRVEYRSPVPQHDP